jgi:hypothetical protein
VGRPVEGVADLGEDAGQWPVVLERGEQHPPGAVGVVEAPVAAYQRANSAATVVLPAPA